MTLCKDDIKYLMEQGFMALVSWSSLFALCAFKFLDILFAQFTWFTWIVSFGLGSVMGYSVNRLRKVRDWNIELRKQTTGLFKKWLDEHK